MTTPLPPTEFPASRLQRLDHPNFVLMEVLDLAEPLARDCGTQIQVSLPARLPALALSAETFRPLLLELLREVLDLSCGDSASLKVRLDGGAVEFEARSTSGRPDSRIDPAALAALSLQAAAVLGTITETSVPNYPALCLRLPIVIE